MDDLPQGTEGRPSFQTPSSLERRGRGPDAVTQPGGAVGDGHARSAGEELLRLLGVPGRPALEPGGGFVVGGPRRPQRKTGGGIEPARRGEALDGDVELASQAGEQAEVPVDAADHEHAATAHDDLTFERRQANLQRLGERSVPDRSRTSTMTAEDYCTDRTIGLCAPEGQYTYSGGITYTIRMTTLPDADFDGLPDSTHARPTVFDPLP
jgi:hypothetical protein